MQYWIACGELSERDFMHDLFSHFFGPGGDQDRLFAWLWPLLTVGFLVGYGLFGTPTLWGWKVRGFGELLALSSGSAILTMLVVGAIWMLGGLILRMFNR